MPSNEPLPTISQLVQASRGGVRGEQDFYADARSGSIHNHAAGPLAIVFSREADADRDNFRAIYFDDADDSDLTTLVEGRTGIDRVLSTAGVGTCTFARSSASAGAGKFWTGTRIQVSSGQGSTAKTRVYTITSDEPITASLTQVTVPIQASAMGTGFAVQGATQGQLQLLDQLYDPLWQPVSLSCADGTSFEPADQYRGRVRATLADNRNGYLPKLLTTVQSQGAAYLIAFAGNYGLPSNIYVDDDYEIQIANVFAGNGGLAVIQTETPHNLPSSRPGQVVTVSGVNIAGASGPPGINGTHAFAVLTPTTLQIGLQFAGSYEGGGTVKSGGQADYGLCSAYVADANFASSTTLIDDCTVALEGVRGLGADLWVGGIQTVAVSLGLLVTLRDDPGKFDLVAITRAITQALLASFSPTAAGYIFKLSAIAGAAGHTAGSGVQTIGAPYAWQPSTQYGIGALVNPTVRNGTTYQCVQNGTSDVTQPTFPSAGTVVDGGVIWQALTTPNLGVSFNGAQQAADPVLVANRMPATLSRYVLPPQNITLTFAGPI